MSISSLSMHGFSSRFRFALLATMALTIGAVTGWGQQGAGQTVLITGANRGLGLEFARQYHAAGWKVIGTARDANDAADLKAIAASVQVESLDVTNVDSIKALAEKLNGEPIDLLINNAGVKGAGGRLPNVDLDAYDLVMRVNAIGPLLVTKALLPNLQAGKGKKIVSISSGLGSIANNNGGGNYGYRESKAALNMLMRTLAAELKKDGFICIPMSPGWVQTDMGGPNANLTPEQSISGMRKVIDNLKAEDSGKFLTQDGEEIAW